jgi:tetratricopeptide (TPR) repeat protein/predicted Ser/Thr protein kinase
VTPWAETVRLGPGEPGPGAAPAGTPPEVALAPPGARFGKYVRTQKLGAGGMGEVWKAWDTVLGRWIALKFLKGDDAVEIARFRREAQTAGRLQHPNIAAIYEVGEDQGRHFIAMQFVDGRTLLAFSGGDRRLLVRLVRDAARAAHFAHEQGVVHRDLKPDNVMVQTRTPSGGPAEHHVFVMDFGLARVVQGAQSLSQSGFAVGTPMYMAPEQARGERVDARADVYSLALTLYELLTGLRPFETASVYETLRKIQETEPPRPRKLDRSFPDDLETVLLKGLAKEPADRYADAAALADDLDSFLKGEPIRGRRESLSRKLVRRVRRHPVASASLAGLVLALAVSGGLGARAFRDRRLGALGSEIERRLAAPGWIAEGRGRLDALVEEVGRLDAGEARAQEARVEAAIAKAGRDALAGGRLEDARAAAALLRDPSGLAGEIRAREALWVPRIRLEPPYDLAGVFGPEVRVETGVLLSKNPRTLTRIDCEGPVELKAEFDREWASGPRVGLLLNATTKGGYAFLLSSTDGPQGPALSTILGGRGAIRLRILRGEAALLEDLVPASELSAEGLRLLAKREGDRLEFQVNERKPVTVLDPFAPAAQRQGVFGLVWPPEAGLRRLHAANQSKPVVPGPLSEGDALFVDSRAEEALERYREAAARAGSGPVRREARYKEALCHALLNREDSARPIFEEVAGGFAEAPTAAETRWAFLADCQLLLYWFKQKEGLDRASALLDKISTYGFSFAQIAQILPPDLQRLVLSQTVVGNVGPNLHRKPEDHVARAEFAVRASELLEPPSARIEYKHHALLRARMLAGQEAEALRTAEAIFHKFGVRGESLDDFCWMLRRQGQTDRALAMNEKGVKVDPVHRVERARIRIARQEWDEAKAEIERALASVKGYTEFSAACLIKGFLLEREGAADAQVQAAWTRGLLRNWKGERPLELYIEGPTPTGMSVLHTWMLASLTGELSDVEAEQLLAALVRFASRDNPVFLRLMRPAVLRGAWRSERGRATARRLSFRDLTFFDAVTQPLYAGWTALLKETCFPAGPLSREDEELLWGLGEDIQAAYRDGRINERYLLPFSAIVQGNPNVPGMGWREVSAMLKEWPRLRGPLAYVFAMRYRRKGDEASARMFLEAATSDSAREGAPPSLKALVEAASR